MTIEEVQEKGMLGYCYVRGSHSQGLNGPDSDYDIGGVYFTDYEKLMGLGYDYEPEVSDKKHDEVYYEFGKWMQLLCKGNPNPLESLFMPQEFVIGKIHPAIQKVIDNKDKFLSKAVVRALSGYAFSQVKKARSLGKKIVNPVTEKKDVLDFCYVADEQGSKPMKEYLAERHLDQKYCGLVNIPNMPNTYGVYYDWAAFFHFEDISPLDRFLVLGNMLDEPHEVDETRENTNKRIENKKFFHYAGIVHPEDSGKSNDVRLSSIPKGEKLICLMTYNKNAYICHCREYREYKEWEKDRNPKRYSKMVEAGYNQKNMCHCIRLLTMAKEISEGKGFNLYRTEDRDFLMGIKNGDYTYEYLIDYAEKLIEEVNAGLEKSNLPDNVDAEFVNQLVIDCRKMYYGK